jgi:FMN phosphatase YigB (HAD superfamily)
VTRVSGSPPVLVLDFDGTVCLGDGPVLAYAGAAFRGVADAAGRHERLRRFLAGEPGGERHPDGYAAVAALARDVLDPAALDAAYLASRQDLASADDLSAPPGLPEFLAGLAGRAHRLLFTNAPPDGLPGTLDRLGLTGVLDEVRTGARKPAGFGPLLDELLADRPPAAVLSVGDHHVNDIAVPLARGCATAHLDRFGDHPGPAHLRAARFEQLYPEIRAWAADPAAFADRHTPTSPTTSQESV